MAVVVSFDRGIDFGCDAMVVENVPELRVASKNARGQQRGRGLNAQTETWTLISTVEWAMKMRPTHQGRWNKKAVGEEMLHAFGRVTQRNLSGARFAVPTFHWMGCSSTTRVAKGAPPCVWDAETRLGWCGDIFGGLGMEGACDSGAALADSILSQPDVSRLPLNAAWTLRTPSPYDEDIASITGSSTGRREPADGLDHTWPAAVKLAQGEELASADSLARYRNRGMLEKDRQRARSVAGQNKAQSAQPPSTASAQALTPPSPRAANSAGRDAEEAAKRAARAERFKLQDTQPTTQRAASASAQRTAPAAATRSLESPLDSQAPRTAASASPGRLPNGRRGLRVAIVGAGPAAMFAATSLAELAKSGEAQLSAPVHLFRSRSKLSATQTETEHNTVYPKPGKPFFDYGCQYLTAGDAWFRGKMDRFEAAGIARRCEVGVLSKGGGYEPLPASQFGWVGPQGMWVFQERALALMADDLGAELQVHNSVAQWPPAPGAKFSDNSPARVGAPIKNQDGTWSLVNGRNESFGPYDVLIGGYASHKLTHSQLTSPATRRVRELLHDHLQFSPVIATCVSFEKPLDLGFGSAFVTDDPRLSWAANNKMKTTGQPYQPGGKDTFGAGARELWTFLAPAEYSCVSFMQDSRGYKKRAFEDALNAMGELVGKNLWKHRPKLVRCLHWENGLPTTTPPGASGFLFDETQMLGWCGDWAVRGGVEGAALSGKRLAECVAQLSRGESVSADALPAAAQPWDDIGERTPPGYVRLGHGVFHLQHEKLRSIESPSATMSAKDAEAFWGKLQAWGYEANTQPSGRNRAQSPRRPHSPRRPQSPRRADGAEDLEAKLAGPKANREANRPPQEGTSRPRSKRGPRRAVKIDTGWGA